MANLHTKILDFRGSDSSRTLIPKGWNSHVHGHFLERLNVFRAVGDAQAEIDALRRFIRRSTSSSCSSNLVYAC